MQVDHFAAVTEAGRNAVLQGNHAREVAPARTGRWGPSIILRPSGAVGAALAMLTEEASVIAGSHHWRSGAEGRAHVTVRALEPYVSSVAEDRASRYVAAARRAIDEVGSIGLVFRGVALSAGTVMAKAIPVDGRADLLRQRLAELLGDDGWLETRVFPEGRDPIWYCSVLHFAGVIADPHRLVAWAAAQCDIGLGQETFSELDLCTWEFEGDGMAPKVVMADPLRSRGPRRGA